MSLKISSSSLVILSFRTSVLQPGKRVFKYCCIGEVNRVEETLLMNCFVESEIFVKDEVLVVLNRMSRSVEVALSRRLLNEEDLKSRESIRSLLRGVEGLCPSDRL